MRGIKPVLGAMVCLLLIAAADHVMATVADAVITSGLARRASSPPVRPVDDLAFDETVEQQLDWTMYKNGDYDQNGEVNISDVTVIGQNFGATSSHLDWLKSRVADGDGNGEVNIADITPIGNNFGSRITHFMVYRADDEIGPFEPNEPWNPASYSTIEFGSAPIPPGGGPRLFSHYLTYPVAGKYYALVAFDGGEASAVRSNVVHFTPVNEPPKAGLTVESAPVHASAGRTVLLVGGASTDADGTIVSIEWDPLGDGQWINTGTAPFCEHQYNKPGEYAPVLRVTDDDGATSTTSYTEPLVFIVEGTVHTQVVDPAPSSGVDLSCAMIAGAPGIAYNRNTPALEMYYVSSDGADPPVWSSPVLVGDGASQPSLAEIANAPCIAYQRDELEFVRAGDNKGSTWDSPSLYVKDPSENISRGTNPQLAVVGGQPVIADGAWGMLNPVDVFITPGSDGAGYSWYGFLLVNEPATTGLKPSIAEFDYEYLGVVYEKYTGPLTRNLQFRRSETDNPFTFWYTVYPVSGGNARLSFDRSLVAVTHLDPDFDVPLVAYWDVASETLRSRLAGSYDGIAWNDVVDIAPAGNTDGHFSLAEIGHQSLIVYSDRTAGELLLSWAANRRATSWSEPRVIDSGAEFLRPSLINFNDYPGVAYYDADAQVLKFTYIGLE